MRLVIVLELDCQGQHGLLKQVALGPQRVRIDTFMFERQGRVQCARVRRRGAVSYTLCCCERRMACE